VLELNEVLKSAYETAVNQSTGTMDGQDKAAAASLIGQLRDHLVTIGNAKAGDKYIFGGYNVTNAPFAVDASGNIQYNGLDLTNATNPALMTMADESINYAVGYDITLGISINGAKLFGTGDDNLYTLFDNFYNALTSDASPDELSGYITKIQDAQGNALAIEAEIGGKTNRLELIQNRFEEDILTYTDRKSKIEDVDEAEAIMNYKMAETVYQASLQVGSDIIQLSLVDFLK
jgi:flagellar hook-associated protein 3 FlgL